MALAVRDFMDAFEHHPLNEAPLLKEHPSCAQQPGTLAEEAHVALHHGQAASALFLNIQVAFSNMQKDQLIGNMRAQNITLEYCQTLLTAKQLLPRLPPYNATVCNNNALLILTKNNDDPNERIISFVDDITLLTSGKTLDDTHKLLRNMME